MASDRLHLKIIVIIIITVSQDRIKQESVVGVFPTNHRQSGRLPLFVNVFRWLD